MPYATVSSMSPGLYLNELVVLIRYEFNVYTTEWTRHDDAYVLKPASWSLR
jgi:hypothetical protein